MKLLVLRHGATEGNACKRYVGSRTNEPLSEEGRAQCLKAGCRLDVDLVYASPMLRAQETARICFPHAAIHTLPGLEEYDFGAFEGRTADEMAQDRDYRAWVESGCTIECPGGNSRASFMARSNKALLEGLEHARQAGRTLAVVVAHGGTIMAAMHAFAIDEAGNPKDANDLDYFAWQVRNAQGYTADVSFLDTGLALSNPVLVSTLEQEGAL